jgi:hypothetical protein
LKYLYRIHDDHHENAEREDVELCPGLADPLQSVETQPNGPEGIAAAATHGGADMGVLLPGSPELYTLWESLSAIANEEGCG